MANTKLQPISPDISLQNVLRDINSRVRISEGKYTNLRERVEITNRNMVEEQRRVIRDLKELNEEIIKLKNEINDLKETNRQIIQELSLFARKENVLVLEKYINLIDFMKFVTWDELEEVKKRGK